MSKRVRISNEALNSYGTWILTPGLAVEQYHKNPVFLYMHRRGEVIGYLKDIRVDGDEITAVPVFDCASELSKRCRKQWEFGSLRMVSVGVEIIEMSDDPKYLKPGQTRPTIIKSKLIEVSLVDIGANDDAIVLHKDGKQITLGKDGDCPLPLLNINQPKHQEMERNKLTAMLGLPDTADDAAIEAAIGALNASKAENATLKAENDTLKAEKATADLDRITALVEGAISEKRLAADKKTEFVELGKQVGADKLKGIFAAMPVQQKVSEIIGHQGGAPTGGKGEFSKLSDVPEAQRLELREKNPQEYAKLYKAEYGIECEIE